jgi:hypothetical protein
MNVPASRVLGTEENCAIAYCLASLQHYSTNLIIRLRCLGVWLPEVAHTVQGSHCGYS